MVAIGGALGAVMRYSASLLGKSMWDTAFPFSTLAINVIGSLMIGYIAAKLPVEALHWRALIITGILGGFTTFSAFSLETLTLWQSGDKPTAALYICASIMLCLASVWLGDWLGRL